MERAVRRLDVCVHRPSRRRCLVVAERPDGTLECVDGDDRRFVCRPGDLVPVGDAPAGGRRAEYRRREQAHAAALRAAVAQARPACDKPGNT